MSKEHNDHLSNISKDYKKNWPSAWQPKPALSITEKLGIDFRKSLTRRGLQNFLLGFAMGAYGELAFYFPLHIPSPLWLFEIGMRRVHQEKLLRQQQQQQKQHDS